MSRPALLLRKDIAACSFGGLPPTVAPRGAFERFIDSAPSGADNSARLILAVMKTPTAGRRCEAFGTRQRGETPEVCPQGAQPG